MVNALEQFVHFESNESVLRVTRFRDLVKVLALASSQPASEVLVRNCVEESVMPSCVVGWIRLRCPEERALVRPNRCLPEFGHH